ncbi:SRPBCC domain-containing protein [Hoyosella rhizosphaerae]|uniref:SRPBCC domain-containing protein n=1 Tax=Hoyosella rhizosphaerae TaxID=1755582 RepID=A0A916XI53_9ACTN|nr:SRPBCC domain-containing protein [Hoyosella rhizosphaerae]MBN4925467.1 SRPBCC domain-containing protein [Hoyosella rhizosphaerae]GGC74946.1 hypothetical protein GCM10011410_30310 [Hoyosella rhizosphaerae]
MKFVKIIGILFVLVAITFAGSYLWTIVTKPGVERTITIAAEPGEVWDILTDFDSYHEWNPFIVESTGAAEVGSVITNTIDHNGSTMQFSPTILVAEPERELRWLGRFIVPGVVDGEHYFLIEDLGNGEVRLTHGEHFRGALVPFASGALDVGDGFDAMNRALKERAE